MSLNVELSKFKVKQGKSHVVDEWMKFLNDNMKDVLLTLENEKMYVESIFREKIEETEYLYWHSIQGDGGAHVEESQYEVDKKHLEYWYVCIDEETSLTNLTSEVLMIQEDVRKSME
ncbi:DUF6176 family protein [Saliterribacillus persicus]|uniref:Uncharacterized protein n=1 Tax=Saliterribacillus persicus TaxID=930114 RepID=A0A368X6I3_9BACI|nr:DUF6176 family protein [Saliterribacillus persicus]RCW62588.1 hypothetical protein DFR57_12531 [Saliterribacillus persicus]